MMHFNFNKCSVLSIGKNNFLNTCTLNNTHLGHYTCKKDVGVYVIPGFHPSNPCIMTRSHTNKVLSFISRIVSNMSTKVHLKLYMTLVRAHFDYAIQFFFKALILQNLYREE